MLKTGAHTDGAQTHVWSDIRMSHPPRRQPYHRKQRHVSEKDAFVRGTTNIFASGRLWAIADGLEPQTFVEQRQYAAHAADAPGPFLTAVEDVHVSADAGSKCTPRADADVAQ